MAAKIAYMAEAIASVEAIDDRTLKFVMSPAEPNMLHILSSSVMSVIEPKSFVALGDNDGVTEIYCTYPFRLESFTVGQETVLVRNDEDSWDLPLAKNTGPTKIAKITFREIAEVSTAFLELKTGGVDMLLGVPADLMGEVAEEAQRQVLILPLRGTSITCRSTGPNLRSTTARRARRRRKRSSTRISWRRSSAAWGRCPTPS